MTVLIELIRELATATDGGRRLNVDVSLVEQKIKNIRHSEPFTDTDYDLAIEACSDKYYEDVVEGAGLH
jgi:hypothetical protein